MLENYLEFLKIIKTCLQKDLCVNVHSRIIHNSPKLEITQYHPPVKQTVIYPYNRILLSRKKAWITDTHTQHVWVSETVCSAKALRHRGIHTTWIHLDNVMEQAKPVRIYRKQISGCLGLSMEGLTKEFFFSGGKWIMQNDYMVCVIVKTHVPMYPKWVYFE